MLSKYLKIIKLTDLKNPRRIEVAAIITTFIIVFVIWLIGMYLVYLQSNTVGELIFTGLGVTFGVPLAIAFYIGLAVLLGMFFPPILFLIFGVTEVVGIIKEKTGLGAFASSYVLFSFVAIISAVVFSIGWGIWLGFQYLNQIPLK